MKFVRKNFGLVIILTIMLSVGVPRASDTDTASFVKSEYSASAGSGEVMGIPYVWQ